MSMPKVFLSYKCSHATSEDLIHTIKSEFTAEAEFLHDVDIQAGTRWTSELYNWLLTCDAAIILISEEANKSIWCRREWELLNARWSADNLTVIPLFVSEHTFTTNILDDIQGKLLVKNIGLPEQADLIEHLRMVLEQVTSNRDLTTDAYSTAYKYLAAHHAWLKWQFHDFPVFNREPYSLADVYIEPECGLLSWKDINDSKKDAYEETPDCGDRVGLLDTVMSHIADNKFEELITVQAGPGAGKSAFSLKLANHLLQEGFTPVLVKFRDLRLSIKDTVQELLDDAIRLGPNDEQQDVPLLEAPILEQVLNSHFEYQNNSISRLVVIMDGWDEVSLTGNESYKAQLSTWLPKIRDYFIRKAGKKVRVILTGRPSAEVFHSGVLRNTTPVCTLRHITPAQLTHYADEISIRLKEAVLQAEESSMIGWQLNTDKLAVVFKHYENWFANEKGSATNRNDATGDILGNPLLAYLSFRVFAETKLPVEQLMRNPTVLYHELINITVDNAGKGQDEQLDNAVHRGGDKLRRLLQEVAATISMFRAESVSFT